MTQENKEEQLNGTSGAEENQNNKNYSKIVREKIPDTPFHITGSEEQGYHITFGKYRLTEAAPTTEQTIDKLKTEKWKIMAGMTIAIMERMFDEKKIA